MIIISTLPFYLPSRLFPPFLFLLPFSRAAIHLFLSASAWACSCLGFFLCVCIHHAPEVPPLLICGSRENRPLSSQWGGWCGTTWAREWLVTSSVSWTDARRNSLCLSENRMWEHGDSNPSHVEKSCGRQYQRQASMLLLNKCWKTSDIVWLAGNSSYSQDGFAYFK